MPSNFKKIDGVLVVLEGTKSNEQVGVLRKNGQGFQFEYDPKYLKSPKAISLGPEMPLTRRYYQSKELFRPFQDRIPSKENPAYPEYCYSQGISPNESNPLILLSTIASRGPSSFLFFPLYQESFTAQDLKKFRENLGLTTREFASCFDISQAGLTRAETGSSGGRDILKKIEIFARYPEVALDQLHRRAPFIHRKKLEKAKQWLIAE